VTEKKDISEANDGNRPLSIDETIELLGADPPREDLKPDGFDPLSLIAFASRVATEMAKNRSKAISEK
jgi:hypothetical protein